jgi:hypothetical protein
MLLSQGAVTPKTSLNNLERGISDLQVVGLVLGTMSIESLRVMGANSSCSRVEGEGEGEGRSEPAGVIGAFYGV